MARRCNGPDETRLEGSEAEEMKGYDSIHIVMPFIIQASEHRADSSIFGQEIPV